MNLSLNGLLEGFVAIHPKVTHSTDRINPKTGKKQNEGIEIDFSGLIPAPEVRDEMKAMGFKFSDFQKIWYARYTPELFKKITDRAAEGMLVDETHYNKIAFNVQITSWDQYERLGKWTNFISDSNFYRNKAALEKSVNVRAAIRENKLVAKLFRNVPASEATQLPPGVNVAEPGEPSTEPNVFDPTPTPAAGTGGKIHALPPAPPEPGIGIKAASSKAKAFTDLADVLNEKAAKINKHIQGKKNHTARMMAQYMSQLYEMQMLEDQAHVANILAGAYLENKVPKILRDIRPTQSGATRLFVKGYTSGRTGHYSVERNQEFTPRTAKDEGIYTTDHFQQALKALLELGAYSAAGSTSNAILEKEARLKAMSIPGFFPTPATFGSYLMDLAAEHGFTPKRYGILEPSAGKGDLAEALAERFQVERGELLIYEYNDALREILNLKGFHPQTGRDFLKVAQTPSPFNLVVMNPPFENGQDVEHVRHAYSLLEPGGRLVSVMSASASFRSDKKYREFREFVQSIDGFMSEPMQDRFKTAFNPTGVNVVVVRLDKPGTAPAPAPDPASPDEMEMIRIRARAKIKILQLQKQKLLLQQNGTN